MDEYESAPTFDVGMSVHEVRAYIAVFHDQSLPTEASVRKWLHRGNITRLPNGRISQASVEAWMNKRNHVHAGRRQSRSVFA